MTHTYVMADLHGRFDLLEKALAAIGMREGDSQRTVVFLGDYVDRGPQSYQIIERLKARPTHPNEKWVCL